MKLRNLKSADEADFRFLNKPSLQKKGGGRIRVGNNKKINMNDKKQFSESIEQQSIKKEFKEEAKVFEVEMGDEQGFKSAFEELSKINPYLAEEWESLWSNKPRPAPEVSVRWQLRGVIGETRDGFILFNMQWWTPYHWSDLYKGWSAVNEDGFYIPGYEVERLDKEGISLKDHIKDISTPRKLPMRKPRW